MLLIVIIYKGGMNCNQVKLKKGAYGPNIACINKECFISFIINRDKIIYFLLAIK